MESDMLFLTMIALGPGSNRDVLNYFS
jgi:hypothetical protein